MDSLPAGYAHIKVVGSFEELAGTPLDGGVNALCWRRALTADFAEVVRLLGLDSGMATLDEVRLRTLPAGAAIDILLEDLGQLRKLGLSPSLDLIRDYPRDDDRILPTDVYSFHVDRGDVPVDTWLCTYHGAASEGLRNDEARLRVDDPATRAALLERYGGKDDAGFRAFLAEHSYDLHYAPAAGAKPFSLGTGNLWRVATRHPGCPVPPFIHRAPAAGGAPRLLLIS